LAKLQGKDKPNLIQHSIPPLKAAFSPETLARLAGLAFAGPGLAAW